MTEKLYHQDAYLQEFEAIVTQLAEGRVTLDRTAFYPGGVANLAIREKSFEAATNSWLAK